jgi:hypothetical protein
VQRAEWEAGHDADGIRANYTTPADFDLGHDVLAVSGEHDLFGDGRVVCLPTYGHTPGHQSLRVRLDGGDVILAADACYLRRSLDALHLPAVVHDREAMLASLRRLRRCVTPGRASFSGTIPSSGRRCRRWWCRAGGAGHDVTLYREVAICCADSPHAASSLDRGARSELRKKS